MADFKVGDNAYYPDHGVGKVVAIEKKEILGTEQIFYIVEFNESTATKKILVPKNNVKNVGLRPLISKNEASEVLDILKQTNVKIDNQTWNRRYREYMEKIRTGSVFEVAEVLRDLFLLKLDKELSFGERQMLEKARSLLIKELALATQADEETMYEEVKEIFGVNA